MVSVSFLAKAAVLVALIFIAYINFNNLNSYAAAIVAPRSPPEVILDLQMLGYSCADASAVLASLTPAQRDGLKRIYTDLYDVYWPLSLMFDSPFLEFVFWFLISFIIY